MPMSEVRRSKSASTWLHNFGCLSPPGLSSPFQGLRDLLEARHARSLAQLSYVEPVVHSKPRVAFLHNEGVADKYFLFLLWRWSG